MQGKRNIWLITNTASGSNDAPAIEAIEQACDGGGLTIVRRSTFPEDPLPSQSDLTGAGIELLAIFAGDGTVNAVLKAMDGWNGQVLVLPGGTMNLLFHRLFADLTLEQVLAAVCNGTATARRPGIIVSQFGHGYAEVMAGPGTAWSGVREAMREFNLLAIATETGTALSETVSGDMVACIDPPFGRPEGYPLLMIQAGDSGLDLIAYYAETTGEVLEQAAAMAVRDFRRGPHENLGRAEEFTLVAPGGDGFGVLLDGELERASGSTRFSLAPCGVDLLATQPND